MKNLASSRFRARRKKFSQWGIKGVNYLSPTVSPRITLRRSPNKKRKFVTRMPLAAANRLIMDAMHGLTEVDPRFWRVIDTREVQRLRWIRQTGLAYLVYPGAEHSRFAHAIGTYGVARRIFQHLQRETHYTGNFSPSQLDGDLELAFTTAALCHDLGHTAFSHVLETILLPKDFRTHEDCTLALLRDREVGEQIRKIGCDLEQVLQLLTGAHWIDGLCRLLSGTIDVDRWDYLMRDAAAAGVVYGNYDLDWIIHSLSLYPDLERRPRLLVEAHRGLVAVEHFFAARKSMYQQVYYHPTVRGAERLLRAVFERACDYTRPETYRSDVENGIPSCLHGVLCGSPPSLDDFVDIDDTVIIAALKCWSRSATDPVLRYLATCLVERRLFKEIRFASADFDTVRASIRNAVQEATTRQSASDLPVIGPNDEKALDYFVLVDECEFKVQNRFDGLLFDCGDAHPKSFDEIQSRPEHDIVSGGGFTRTKIFVPSEIADSVRTALRDEENI